jgi:ssDNA-binding Zn-finger/Zn-ribbon topoisomerase 1
MASTGDRRTYEGEVEALVAVAVAVLLVAWVSEGRSRSARTRVRQSAAPRATSNGPAAAAQPRDSVARVVSSATLPSAPSTERMTAPVTQSTSTPESPFLRSTTGFIPDDRCQCGGSWVKHVNSVTGGRFFGCSNYPRCTNTRDRQERLLNGPPPLDLDRFCKNGHKRTSDNTYIDPSGHRSCRECRRISEAGTRSTGSRDARPSTLTSVARGRQEDGYEYCRNGHQRTPENTYVRPDGERECRICRKNARR